MISELDNAIPSVLVFPVGAPHISRRANPQFQQWLGVEQGNETKRVGEKQTDRQTDRRTDGWTDGRRDGWTDRETDRDRDKQRQRHRDRERLTER